MDVEPCRFEADGGARHVETPGAGDRLSGNGDGLVPMRLEARHPVAQRSRVVRTKRLDVMDLEPRALCGPKHDRQCQELAIGEHIGVDEGATGHKPTEG